jgi:hypothetical protein
MNDRRRIGQILAAAQRGSGALGTDEVENVVDVLGG